jgi:hypothetical protein
VTAFFVVVITLSYYLLTYQPDLYPFRKLDGIEDVCTPTRYRPNPIDKFFLHYVGKLLPRKLEYGNGPYSRLEKALINVSTITVHSNIDINCVVVRTEHE